MCSNEFYGDTSNQHKFNIKDKVHSCMPNVVSINVSLSETSSARLPDEAGIGRSENQARGGTICVQMDFTGTFQTATKCKNINHVRGHFYKILVV